MRLPGLGTKDAEQRTVEAIRVDVRTALTSLRGEDYVGAEEVLERLGRELEELKARSAFSSPRDESSSCMWAQEHGET